MKKSLALYRNPALYIALAGEKGRGVFCGEDIKTGDTIEIAPVMVFDEKESEHLAQTRLDDYYFEAAAMSRELQTREKIDDIKTASFVAMGIVSFCNHLRAPNAKATFTDELHTGFYVLKAVKDIPKNTEICIDYGITWFAFHRKKKKPAAVKDHPEEFRRGE